jgi:hypothetical protein
MIRKKNREKGLEELPHNKRAAGYNWMTFRNVEGNKKEGK